MRNTDFPNLDGLVGLAKNDGVDIRPTLLRVLTDLYIQKPKHSPEETRHYTELALRLIDAVDVQVRATIAARLARHPDAPLPVIHTLARDVIEVARPVLQYARGLNQRELLKIAQELGQAYATVIATRPDFAPGTTVAESMPDDPTEAVETAAPPAPVAQSANPAEELSELFFGADAAERRLILLNLDFTPLPEALPIASSIAQETNQRLEMAAMQRDVAGFAQELERVLGIARPHARRLADDMSGETVVIAAKALQMPPAMLQRVLLFLNPAIGQSVARVYELSALYEEVTGSSVLRLLAIWQDIHPREARRSHQAYHWHGAKDDAQRSVQRSVEIARPAARRAKS